MKKSLIQYGNYLEFILSVVDDCDVEIAQTKRTKQGMALLDQCAKGSVCKQTQTHFPQSH